MEIKLTVFGTKQTIQATANPQDTVVEVLQNYTEELSFKSENNSVSPIVLFNGKIINTYITLPSQGVTNGSTLILLYKNNKNNKNNENCENCENNNTHTFFFEPSLEERNEYIEESLIEERCRLADLGFTGWECDSKGGQILREAYDAEQAVLAEEDEETQNFELFMHGTVVISKPTEICDKPLPKCFLLYD